MMRTPSLVQRALSLALSAALISAVIVGALVYAGIRILLEDDLDALLNVRRDVASEVITRADGDLAATAVLLAELGIPARIITRDGLDLSVAPVGHTATLASEDVLGDPDAAVRVIATPEGRVEVLASRQGIKRELQRILFLAGSGLLLTLTVGYVVLRPIIRRALTPLVRMSEVVRRSAEGVRGERLHPDDVTTYLGALASELDHMLDALESTVEAARTAERAQRLLLADVAHQLRTPMAGIRVSAELLLLQQDMGGVRSPAERQRLLSNLVRETTRATRMVNGLLRIARFDLDAGLLLRSTDLVELCAAEVARQAMLADVPVLFEVIEAPVTSALIDPDQIQEVLANLLDNARRFAHSRIDVTLDELDSGGIVIRVIDDGPGLAPEDRERAFERFVTFGTEVGTGLGLPIARGIMEAHGGRLDFIDGAFELRLPGAIG